MWREIPDGSQQEAGNQKGRLRVSLRQKKGNIKIRDEIQRRNNIQVLAGDKKTSQGKEGQEKMGISDACHKFGTPVHKTNHQRYSRGVQKAMAYREQLQISRTDTCPHM